MVNIWPRNEKDIRAWVLCGEKEAGRRSVGTAHGPEACTELCKDRDRDGEERRCLHGEDELRTQRGRKMSKRGRERMETGKRNRKNLWGR